MTRFLLWLPWYLVFYQNPCVSGVSFGPSCIQVTPDLLFGFLGVATPGRSLLHQLRAFLGC